MYICSKFVQLKESKESKILSLNLFVQINFQMHKFRLAPEILKTISLLLII